MPSDPAKSPKYLVLRIPSRFYLTEPYKLSESISLLPGPRHEPNEDERVMSYDCTFFYVEENPPLEQIGPPTWPSITSYKNLRKFIVFWAFLTRQQESIRAFEIGEGPIVLDKPPSEQPSCWNNNPVPLNPAMFPVDNSFLALDAAFIAFQNSGSLQDLVALLVYQPNSYVADGRRVAYSNYLLSASLIWFVVDSLLPSETCGGKVQCPKCGQEAHLSHSRTTFCLRAEEALRGFQHAAQYSQFLDSLRRIRGKFVHKGTLGKYPDTEYLDADPMTGIHQREITFEDLHEKVGIEGLATKGLLVAARQIAYWLLFNKLFPGMNIWPEIDLLSLWATQ